MKHLIPILVMFILFGCSKEEEGPNCPHGLVERGGNCVNRCECVDTVAINYGEISTGQNGDPACPLPEHIEGIWGNPCLYEGDIYLYLPNKPELPRPYRIRYTKNNSTRFIPISYPLIPPIMNSPEPSCSDNVITYRFRTSNVTPEYLNGELVAYYFTTELHYEYGGGPIGGVPFYPRIYVWKKNSQFNPTCTGIKLDSTLVKIGQ